VSESINFDRADYVEVSALIASFAGSRSKTILRFGRRNNLCSIVRDTKIERGRSAMPVHTASFEPSDSGSPRPRSEPWSTH